MSINIYVIDKEPTRSRSNTKLTDDGPLFTGGEPIPPPIVLLPAAAKSDVCLEALGLSWTYKWNRRPWAVAFLNSTSPS